MAFDRAAAKAAGYSDEEIDAYIQANPEVAAESTNPSTDKDIVDSLPAPTTVVPEVDRTNEAVATGAVALGPAVLGTGASLLGGAAAYQLGKRVIVPGLVNAGLNAMEKRAAAKGAVAPTTAQGAPVQETKGSVKPSGTARQLTITDANTPQRSTILNAQGEPITRAPVSGSVAPQAPAATPVSQAAQAAEKPGMLKNFAQIAGKYGTALAESPLGKTLGGAARIAGSVPAMAAGLATYSGGLNEGEDQQLARMRAIQNTIGKMPKEQQSFYFTLPPNKKQQIDQMIMSGQDPSALLVPNAINSGFEQKLKTLGR